jgi:predicted GNAT family acetyltransferase
MTRRRLASADAAALDRFLASHRDSSMFLRSNLRRAGFTYRGRPYEAVYVATMSGGDVTGVAAHAWNHLLLLQAPDDAAAVAGACVAESRRPVSGIIGPAAQVREARAALGLAAAAAATDSTETLYAVDLADVVVPDALADRVRASRPPRAGERDLLAGWRLAYDMEALGAEDTAAQRRNSAAFLDAQIAEGHVWVATEDDAPVSLSAFNATLPDMVQVGGVYTPPALRRRGHARVAVAASLLAGRARGVSRAVLFTSNPNAARAYEAIGFRAVGDYAVLLFPRAVPPARR